jgi:predicted secreted hydrolase
VVANAWKVSDVFLAHFAVTDASSGRFFHADRVSRTGPGLAGASPEKMDVWTLDWSARMEGNRISIAARHKGMEIKLMLTRGKPPVFHGQWGLSRKGPGEGQSSYYYSLTDLKTEGTLQTPGTRGPVPVKGVSWFDQEFGSNQLTPEQVGWDWFGIHLSDGRDLMIYLLRKKDGSLELTSSGTVVEKDGTTRHLKLSDISITVLDRWKSPRSGGIYPAKWLLRIPFARLEVTLSPILADQELTTEASTGITYWEGAVGGTGLSRDQAVTAEGYTELTGYAGSLGGVF